VLVIGASPDSDMDTQKTLSVKVLRPFLLKTVRQEAGKVMTLDRRLAVELAAINKVEVLKPEVAAAAAVADLKPAPEPKAKGKTKESWATKGKPQRLSSCWTPRLRRTRRQQRRRGSMRERPKATSCL
jgi:hypothetical protein